MKTTIAAILMIASFNAAACDTKEVFNEMIARADLVSSRANRCSTIVSLREGGASLEIAPLEDCIPFVDGFRELGEFMGGISEACSVKIDAYAKKNSSNKIEYLGFMRDVRTITKTSNKLQLHMGL